MGDERRDVDGSGQPDDQNDLTEPIDPVEPRPLDDATSVISEGTPWSGRAGVPVPGGPGLRDSVPHQDQEQVPGPGRLWWTPVLLGVVALGLLGVVILAAWLMGRDREPQPSISPAPSLAPATTSPARTTRPASPTASPAATVQIPRLTGMTQDQATQTLDALGLSYRLEFRQAPQPQGMVVESRPGEGQVVPVNSAVTLVMSTGPGSRPTTRSPTPTAAASAEPD